MVEAMIQLAHGLGMTPLAEGIETDGRARVPARHGCTRGQGFLFARPVPAEEIPALARPGRPCYPPSSNRSARRAAGCRPLPSADHAPLRPRRDRAEVAAGLGGRGALPGLRRSRGPPAPLLRARHVPVPLGRPPPGARGGLQRRRRRSRGSGGCRGTTSCIRSAGTRSGSPRRTRRSSAGSIRRNGPTRTSSSRRRRSSGWASRSTGPAGSTAATPSTTAGRSGCS